MYYFKIKFNKNKYNYYCIENNMLYNQQTYAGYYELNIDDLMVSNKFFTYINDYSNKVDFYTENIFDYSLSKLSYNYFLRQIVSSILRDIKISKLLE